jgi:hypothetical protein
MFIKKTLVYKNKNTLHKKKPYGIIGDIKNGLIVTIRPSS